MDGGCTGTGPVLRYGDSAVYDACSLVTIDGLARHGVELNDDVVVAHDYMDGDVPPDAAVKYRELGLSLNMWDNPRAASDLNAYQCDPGPTATRSARRSQ